MRGKKRVSSPSGHGLVPKNREGGCIDRKPKYSVSGDKSYFETELGCLVVTAPGETDSIGGGRPPASGSCPCQERGNEGLSAFLFEFCSQEMALQQELLPRRLAFNKYF